MPASENPLAKLVSTSNCVVEPNATPPVPKTPKNEPAAEEKPAAANGSTTPAEATPAAAKKRVKAAKTTTAKKTGAKKTSAKKKSGSGAAKKAKPSRAAGHSEPAEPSDSDIRLRAYFIAERRVQLALQGDPARDWIEARQQLIEESRRPRS